MFVQAMNTFRIQKLFILMFILIFWIITMIPGSPVIAGEPEKIKTGEPEKIKIGVLAKRGAEQCLVQWSPTADYLSGKIDGFFFEIIPLGYDEVYSAVENGEVDFVLTNPAYYAAIEQWYGAIRIATLKNRFMDTAYIQFGGVIFRLKNRDDIRGIEDLIGKSFMATDEHSLGGWISVWRELKEHGVDPHRHFSSLQFAGDHDSVVLAVRDGLVDAGSVRTDNLERMAAEGKINIDEFVVFKWPGDDNPDFPFLRSTRLYPEWALARLPVASEELAEMVTVALLQMPSDSEAAKAGEHFGWTIPRDYQPVHECLRYLKLGPYKDLGKITLEEVIQEYWHWFVFLGVAFVLLTAFTGVVLRQNDHIHESKRRLAEEVEQRRKTDEELKVAKKAAEEATKAKSEFLANMSHEIRTPMNGVIAAAELAMNEQLPPKVSKYVKIIMTSAHSLLGLINDILDFSKIEAGKLNIESRTFMLDEIVDRVVELFFNSASAKRIELLVHMNPEVPRALIGDPMRLQQILTNLVGNSVKFTKKGGFILIGAKASALSNNNVELNMWVKDTGVGISKEYQKKLFQPFTQADASDTRHFEGTGLGLSICKRLVDMMDGRIWVESEPGKGSTFNFTVKLKRARHEPARVFVPPAELKFLHVLVVDDCEDSRIIVTKYLESFGFTVEIAESGKRALTMVENRENQGTPFNLVLMDWLIPEIDGLEVSRRIREKSASAPPIIMMTAFGSDMEKAEAEKIGIQGFLTKPIYQSTLFNAIMDAFGKEKYKKMRPLSRLLTDSTVYKRRLKGFRVLVVEDNPTNQEIAVAILESAGIIPDTAINGSVAVEKISKNRYDAVLMDIQMPEMNGFQATRKIRHDLSITDLPIIAMTAHAMRGDEEKCMIAGMDGYVAKPVEQARLFQLLWRLLKNRRPVLEAEPLPSQAEPDTRVPGFDTRALPDKVPGIHIREALENMRLEPAVYRRIIYGFRRNNLHIMDSMQQALEEKDTDRLTALAHSLKGSSSNIGAHDLESASKKLEAAAANQLDCSVLEPLAQKVGEALGIVLTSILQLENANEDDPVVDTSGETSDNGSFKEVVDELAEALRLADPEDINRILSHVKGFAQWRRYSAVERLIKQYDYDEALEILTKNG
jgi:signal transduction histidine kinase/DNA-binding response OmpR family regulator/ABC-type phosphate/phosphonate transport system substrate-binding protein/HPt (histidine-containing phosphotransfer) domain-containing protein